MEDSAKSFNTPIYTLPGVSTTSPLDMLEKILSVYSTYYTLSGKGHKTLRPQLLKALAVYVLHGYNKESKMLAHQYCQLKKGVRIDGLNKELRDGGYLVKHPGNDHKNNLNEDLISLGENFPKVIKAIPKLEKSGINSLKMSINIDLKFPI